MLNDFSNASRSSVFCDYMRFTVPQPDRESTMSALKPYLDAIGCYDDYGFMRSASGGTLTVKNHYQVTSFSFSGRLLADLRDYGLWPSILADIVVMPRYRLTKAHLTQDIYYPGYLYVPWFYRQCRDGHLSISRKSNVEGALKQYFSPSHYAPDYDTGTVYLGTTKAEIRLKAYDKQQEQFDRYKKEVLPTTRLELELSDKMGITIRDLADATECFYHYIPKGAIHPPQGLKGWKAYDGIGDYRSTKESSPTPYKKATMLLEQIEPTLKSISKLSMVQPEGSEAFRKRIMSKVSRILAGAS